ncbi:Virulence protein [Vibrio thalassae]|uniref:Virulence protein n=1 Tax=Vibrio thalassae TaxID=1243014 RepID=A0A240EQF1_9VIBR|nr:VOC family protein [Vibrio thalassae]SNX50848.1 Virulence protein [Vibrio thalassae]
MNIQSIDHLVLTVADLQSSVEFYETLGMRYETFGYNRHALHFGSQKINLHIKGQEIEPKATFAVPGSEDLCFVIDTPVGQAKQILISKGIDVFTEPVNRTGATDSILSIYLRDPDGNLIELCNYQ